MGFAFWPALLLLPLLLLWFGWQSRRSVTDLSPGRQRLTLLLRGLLTCLLVGALAGARTVRRSESLAVVFVVDGSRSVVEAQQAFMERYLRDAGQGRRAVDTVGLITFAREPHTQSLPGQPFDPTRLKDPGVTTATDIAQALRQARSVLQATAREVGKRVVLLSDGEETVGNARAEAAALAAEGIPLDTVALPETQGQEALIAQMTLPAQVKVGEPFTVRIVVVSRTSQRATVALTRDGVPVAPPQRVELHRGKNVVVFPQRVAQSGFMRYAATLDAPQDTVPENNRGEGFVQVRGRPSVLIIADSAAAVTPLRRALETQDITAEFAPPEAVPTTPELLQRFDGIFLSNVPYRAFSEGQQRALQTGVRDYGIGFGMIGGPDSFGAGGYKGSVFEEMLPVRMEMRKPERVPAVCVALVIDRSGSMADGQGVSKMRMAQDAAIRAVQALKPSDKVAVIVFDDLAEVRVPLTPVGDGAATIAALRNIRPGGGTSIYSGAKLAFDTIEKDTTPVKHILLLTDGLSVDPDYTSLISAMKRRKITVSSVVLGAGTQDMYRKTLARLAQETGGRFYSVENAQEIPSIYLQEMERITTRAFIEEAFTPRATERANAVLPGLPWNRLPPLLGYNVTQAKPTADVLLTSHRKDPILATWRYGLGRTLAFTSDDRNRWGAAWLAGNLYTPFWATAARWTLRATAPDALAPQVTLEGGHGHLVVEARDAQGRSLHRLRLRARIAPPNGESERDRVQEESLRETGPGRYEAEFDASQTGTYLIRLTGQAGENGEMGKWRNKNEKGREISMVLGLSNPYPAEYRALQTDRALLGELAQIGGGCADPLPNAIFQRNRPAFTTVSDLTGALLSLALLLLPLDIAARRLRLERADLSRALNRLRTRTVPIFSKPPGEDFTDEASVSRIAAERRRAREQEPK